jgi:hypothetical protein
MLFTDKAEPKPVEQQANGGAKVAPELVQWLMRKSRARLKG